MRNEKNKKWLVFALIPFGLLINYFGARLVLRLGIPIFFDCAGTLIASALGGFLPGLIVGFFSNLIISLSDPITVYYGVINVLIGLTAAAFANKGYFNRLRTALPTSIAFAVIGGGLGSLLTWALYGLNIGEGISAPLAVFYYENVGMDKFFAQLSADLIIDLADKLITVLLVFIFIKLLPIRLVHLFPLGARYGIDPQDKPRKAYRRASISFKVAMLILITALILTSIALPISYTFFSQTMDDRFAREGVSAVNTISNYIDADEIPGYLENGRDDSYDETEQKLYSFREANPEIRFLYIYKIMSDGCHVVFDLDTPDVPAGRLGDVIPFEEAFSADIETLINGGEIEPVISNGVYGWLYSFYKPLTGTDGTTKAYIAVDIDMRDIISNRYAFIARVFSLLLGASIIIVAFSIWFAQARFTKPLNELTESTDQLVYDNKQDRQIKLEKLKSLKLNTGDEIENIYHAVLRTTEEVSYYLEIIRDNRDDIAAKAKVISQLQDNFIISFADMVENRDQNTGDHIKHTSAYVHAVAVSMKSLGMYTETLTDEYIDNITKSAPLHDIGKIRIPDSILNKPGSLTPEEFEIIKTHTTEGKRILTRVFAGIEGYNYLSEAIGMATYHHEKWDGSGYPEGLSGENIPLCARIMAIADVFDALISRHSYKNSFSFDKALTIISDSSGTHFDPNVVHAFIAASKEICEIPMTEGAAKTAENPSGLTSSLV